VVSLEEQVRTIHIIHIDDDEDFLFLTKAYVEKLSNKEIIVDTLSNPRKILDGLVDEKYNAIVCDYLMPEMTGIEVLKQIKTFFDIPFILFTGKGREEVVIEALNLGATYYIRKGIDIESQYTELINVVKNVVKLKRAEEAVRRSIIRLNESEEKYRRLFEESSDAIFIHRLDGHIIDINQRALDLFGYSREEFLELQIKEFHPERALEKSKWAFETILKDGHITFEIEFLKKNGETFFAGISSSIFELKGQKVIQAIIRDITERIEHERELKKLNRLLKMLYDCKQALLDSKEESTLLEMVCEIIIDIGGYRLAWVGFAEDDENKTVRPVAIKGFEKGYTGLVNITWADTERGQGPTGTAIRTKKVSITRDILTNPKYELWREEALKRGYTSSISIPIIINDKAIGSLNIYSSEKDPFNKEEVELLVKLTQDVAYGLKHLRTQRALKEREHRLEMLFENMADAILVADPKTHRFIDCNREAVNLLGYSREELLELRVEDIHPEEVLEETTEAFSKCSRGERFAFETKIITKNGERIPVSINSALIQIEGKEYLEGIFRFISKKYRAEALNEVINLYQAIFENTGTAMAIIEENSIISHVNKEFEILSGYKKEEIEEKKSWTEFIHKDDLERMKKFHYKRREDPSSSPVDYEFRFIDRYGNIKNISLHVNLIPGTSKSIASLIDITNKKKQNKLLEKVKISIKRCFRKHK